MMKPILSGLLIFMFLYIVADIFVKQQTIGLSSSEVSLTLFGNTEEFLDPISKAVFLETLHAEVFFLMMILLMLSAVFIRLRAKKRFSITLLNITMTSALLALLSLALAYFFSASFINLYVVTFFLWHCGALLMSALSLWSLYRA